MKYSELQEGLQSPSALGSSGLLQVASPTGGATSTSWSISLSLLDSLSLLASNRRSRRLYIASLTSSSMKPSSRASRNGFLRKKCRSYEKTGCAVCFPPNVLAPGEGSPPDTKVLLLGARGRTQEALRRCRQKESLGRDAGTNTTPAWGQLISRKVWARAEKQP